MVTAFGYFDFVETFPKPGCAICNLLLRAVDRYLDSMLYEYVNDRDTHLAFRAARGMCNEHSWQLTQYKGSALGVAILYRATVDEVLKIMGQAPAEPTSQSTLARFLGVNSSFSGDALAEHLEPTSKCTACELLARSEKTYVEVLSESINDPKLQEAYRTSDGLCLPHFRQVLRQTSNPDHLQQFISTQTEIWTHLKADLTEFIDKMDHTRSHEKMGPEGDSWQRAIRQMAAAKGVFGVEPRTT